jgi:hypothetical protein
MNRWPTLPVQPKTAQFFFWGAMLCIRLLNSPRSIQNNPDFEMAVVENRR